MTGEQRQDAPDDGGIGVVKAIRQFNAALACEDAPDDGDEVAPIVGLFHLLQERLKFLRGLRVPVADGDDGLNVRLPLRDMTCDVCAVC